MIDNTSLLKIGIKEFPEKLPLEVKDDDILIIEDEIKTCQISVKSLRTALLGAESVQDVIDMIRGEFQKRIEECEMLYPFRLNDAYLLPNTEFSSVNQDNVEISFKKKSMKDYEVIITELEDSNGLVEYELNEMNGSFIKWVGVVLDFNINSSFIESNKANQDGEWATGYELDNTNLVYKYSAKNDLSLHDETGNNKLLIWVDMSDLQQTFAFEDADGNIIRALFKFRMNPEKEDPEPAKTYTVYVPEDEYKDDVDISVTDNLGTRVFNMVYNKDIPYTLKDETNELPQSGNWIKLRINPPAGHALPTALTVDGLVVTVDNLVGPLITNSEEDEREPGDYDYLLVPHGETEDNPYYIDMYLRYARDNQIHVCVFTWGADYTDTVVISVNNIVLPDPPTDPDDPNNPDEGEEGGDNTEGGEGTGEGSGTEAPGNPGDESGGTEEGGGTGGTESGGDGDDKDTETNPPVGPGEITDSEDIFDD